MVAPYTDLEATFRQGMDLTIMNPETCTDPDLERFRDLQYPEHELLAAAHCALQGAGIESATLAFGDEHSNGALSNMRVLHNTSSTKPTSYAMVMQQPMPLSEWRDGATRVLPAPGNMLPRFHAAEFEVVERVREQTGASAPQIIASHQDVGHNTGFTFSLQEYVAGKLGNRYITEQPEQAERIVKAMGIELAQIHRLAPDVSSNGYFLPEAADDGYLLGYYGDARSHYMAALERTLLQMQAAKVITARETTSLFRFYLESPLIDTLNLNPRVLHGDYGVHNTIFDPLGRAHVIDFAFTLSGPPEYDLALAYDSIAFSGRHHWPAFLQGYEQGGGVLRDHFEETFRATRLRALLSRLGAISTLVAPLATSPSKQEQVIALIQDRMNNIRRDADYLGIPMRKG